MDEYSHQEKIRDKKKIVFTGNFAYTPNLMAVRFIVNELAPIMPEFNFCFAGSNMPTWIKSMNASNIKIFENTESMGEFLSDAFLSLVPLTEGCGTRMKVLEAFGAGVPVISTTIGVEGLDLKSGHHYLEANSPLEFVKSCKILLVDSQKYNTISGNAYEFVQKNHSIAKLSSDLQTYL
jgi:glycosyltransferase involved in cell wall biosynthesis